MTKASITFETPQNVSQGAILAALRSICTLSTVRISIESPIIYPLAGASSIRRIKIDFNKPVSKDAVESLVKYWGEIPYTGKYSGVDFIGGSAIVKIDVSQTRSHDVASRNILELLCDFLENGTPVRKRDNTRAINGLGEGSVKSIVGLS